MTLRSTWRFLSRTTVLFVTPSDRTLMTGGIETKRFTTSLGSSEATRRSMSPTVSLLLRAEPATSTSSTESDPDM